MKIEINLNWHTDCYCLYTTQIHNWVHSCINFGNSNCTQTHNDKCVNSRTIFENCKYTPMQIDNGVHSWIKFGHSKCTYTQTDNGLTRA